MSETKDSAVNEAMHNIKILHGITDTQNDRQLRIVLEHLWDEAWWDLYGEDTDERHEIA
jgi:hypothetical protein